MSARHFSTTTLQYDDDALAMSATTRITAKIAKKAAPTAIPAIASPRPLLTCLLDLIERDNSQNDSDDSAETVEATTRKRYNQRCNCETIGADRLHRRCVPTRELIRLTVRVRRLAVLRLSVLSLSVLSGLLILILLILILRSEILRRQVRVRFTDSARLGVITGRVVRRRWITRVLLVGSGISGNFR